MMENDCVMNRALFHELENFSCKFEILLRLVEVLHNIMLGSAIACDHQALERAVALTDALLELTASRNREIHGIVNRTVSQSMG